MTQHAPAPGSTQRRVLVVRGGWEGHDPVGATELFRGYLERAGFRITVADTLDAYTDRALLAGTDLIVQCWSMGRIAAEQLAGLADAVASGVGLAGWHGGIVAAFDAERYLQLVGGRFVAHPGGFVDHQIVVRPARANHAIVAGLDRVRLHTEQYWVLSDAASDVLATTTLPAGPDTPWPEPVTCPAVWTRRWGSGRIFVSTVGHAVADLRVPEIRALTERGLAWAARHPSPSA